jgi:hypothetical protein
LIVEISRTSIFMAELIPDKIPCQLQVSATILEMVLNCNGNGENMKI